MQVTVPARFWDDHVDRYPCDYELGETCAEEVKRSGNRVTIEGTPAQIEVLRSDAAFYCDRWGPDDCPQNIIRSARATLDALAKTSS